MKTQLEQKSNQVNPLSFKRNPTREICLDRVQAVRWRDYLEGMFPTIEPNNVLARFCRDLSDACWLARWTREKVLIDVELASIPELVELLLFDNTEDHEASDLVVAQEIANMLVRNG